MKLVSGTLNSLPWVEGGLGVSQREVQLVQGGLLLVGQHLGLEYRMLTPQVTYEGHAGS